jgi:ornithine cyclodeaminase/alanine dehydrogenase-like protein (mu-crystallin family)
LSHPLVVMDAAAVRRRLTLEVCIPLMRQAMRSLSSGQVEQHLRSFLSVGEGRTFALMPAAFDQGFGAKLVSVYPQPEQPGRRRHQGLVILFDPETGAPAFVGDAEEITRIRTAAASAAATEILARPDSRVLALLGAGRQAEAHLQAIAAIRPLTEARVWGRDRQAARDLAGALQETCGFTVRAVAEAQEAVSEADIICTVTASRDPVLRGDWVAPGTHVNLVGSSGPQAAEADADLVARSRFIGDHREHVLAHGGEFLRARETGRIGDDHFVGEIGEVYAGRPGRLSASEITVYKSLGHAVQDLAAAAWLLSSERTAHG